MTVDQSDLFADVGQHVADMCVRCYMLEAILTEFFEGASRPGANFFVAQAAAQALERLRAMGGNPDGQEWP